MSDDLEPLARRAFKSLPPPNVPETLAPRIMAAVMAARAPRRAQRGWLAWPVGWQIASAALAVALITGAAMLESHTSFDLVWSWGLVRDLVPARVVTIATDSSRALTSMQVIGRSLVVPAALSFAAILGLILTGGGVAWTLLNRVALGGASHS